MNVKQVCTTCRQDALVAEGEGSLYYSPVAGIGQEEVPVATGPEVDGDIRAQGMVAPICMAQQMSDDR